jgi:hypothetical protein
MALEIQFVLAWEQSMHFSIKKLSTILKRTYQLESYVLIIPIMLHHFRINLLLSATMKHNSRNRGYER